MRFYFFTTCTELSCPVLSTVGVSLSSSFEEAGRDFACPGEIVTFTCEVNESIGIQIAAENFICRNDPVTYLPTDAVGSSGHPIPNATFQANLTNVDPESDESGVANLTATWTAITTDEINNAVVECTEARRSDLVQRKTLTQSCKTE